MNKVCIEQITHSFISGYFFKLVKVFENFTKANIADLTIIWHKSIWLSSCFLSAEHNTIHFMWKYTEKKKKRIC